MRHIAWLILFLTLLLWAGNWIVARAVRDEVAPGIATMGRLLIVLAVLAPFTWRGLIATLPRLSGRDWRVLGALGFTGGGLHIAMQWLGLHFTTATSGMLYLSTSPVFILLLSAPLLGERIRAAQWIGVTVSFAGVAVIATGGHPTALLALRFNPGDLLAIASMAMWGAYTVCLRLRRDTLDTAAYITLVCTLGLAWMTPWVAWELAAGAPLRLSPAGYAGIAYSAIGSLLLAYAGWSYVVKRLGAARAGVTMHLMPAIGIVLSAIFLAEYPQAYHFTGIGLILAGVALATVRRRAAQR